MCAFDLDRGVSGIDHRNAHGLTEGVASPYAGGMRWFLTMLLCLGFASPIYAAVPGEPLPAEKPCRGVKSLADFIKLTTQGETAFRALDVEGLNEAANEARRMVPCLGDRVRPVDAAAFHRLQALSAFANRKEGRTLREFHAARRLDPGWMGISDVAPAGHPLLTLYEASLTAVESRLEPIQPPPGGFVNVDGIRGAPRPVGLSSIVQVYASDTHLLQSLFLAGDQATPVFGTAWKPDDPKGRLAKKMVIGFAIADTVGALGCYALSVQARKRFDDESTPYSELESLQGRTNTMFMASAIMGGAAVVLGATAVISW